MNTLLTKPVVSPVTGEEEPVIGSAAGARPQTVVQPRARILYVDDEPAMRRLGRLVLVQAGYEVDTAADGAEAWMALQEVSYHLLITDHNMPRLTGLELAKQARLAGMRLPIVLASGSPNAPCDPASSWLGLAARLSKPFDAETLVETVAQVLRVANGKGECIGAMISVLEQVARAQPFPHGGINE